MPAGYPPEQSSHPLSHYPLVPRITSNGIPYTEFVTKFGVTYEMYFTPDANFIPDYTFAAKAFSFTLAISDDEWRKGADSQIQSTVEFALNSVFENDPELIISYTTSVANRLERMRSITFGRWLSKYQEEFERLTYRDEAASTVTFFRKGHHATKEIKECFDEVYLRK